MQTTHLSTGRSGALLFFALLTLATSASHSDTIVEPISVSHSISIRNGDWIPLPIEDMRRAAGDAALSRLSDAGRLRLLRNDDPGIGDSDVGSLDLEIALIGPAETAKLTIRLDTTDSPTLVSTASISVRALDHAGIYDALEHVGVQAADRLVAKLDLLRTGSVAGAIASQTHSDDPARRRLYEAAQAAKRAARYPEARASFEALVASAEDPTDTLRRLAENELRYGLPLFEAQQSLNTLGHLSRPGQQKEREAALSRAENLYRQIQAENPSNVTRVTEAQHALDQLLVTRGAMANVMRAHAQIQLNGLRMGMMEFVMMTGECPNREQTLSLIDRMRTRINLDEIQTEVGDVRLYGFSEHGSRNPFRLRCSDFEIEIVDSERRDGPSRNFPASHIPSTR